MVALIILSIAVTGVAAMQLHALRLAQYSAYQTIATQLAAELIERMRANEQQVLVQHSAYLFSYNSSPSTAIALSLTCYDTHCDSAAIARHDISTWQQQLQEQLPLARVVVCRDSSVATQNQAGWQCDDSPRGLITIKLGWSAKEVQQNKRSAPPLLVITAGL